MMVWFESSQAAWGWKLEGGGCCTLKWGQSLALPGFRQACRQAGKGQGPGVDFECGSSDTSGRSRICKLAPKQLC